MDLRHLIPQYRNFTYGEDWGISITINDQVALNDAALPVEMPEQFLSKETYRDNNL